MDLNCPYENLIKIIRMESMFLFFVFDNYLQKGSFIHHLVLILRFLFRFICILLKMASVNVSKKLS